MIPKRGQAPGLGQGRFPPSWMIGLGTGRFLWASSASASNSPLARAAAKVAPDKNKNKYLFLRKNIQSVIERTLYRVLLYSLDLDIADFETFVARGRNVVLGRTRVLAPLL